MLHQFQCMKEGSLFYYQHGFGSLSGIIEFCPVCGHDEVRATGRTFPDLDEGSPLPITASEDEDDEVNPGPWNDPEGVFFDHAGQTFGPFATEEEAEIALAEEQRTTGRAI